ncbi:MAG: hypothetical protein IT328_14090 [Caldilineaceae bacterium]|nr:hypothetical protein [Caldilineaceae bacterium]
MSLQGLPDFQNTLGGDGFQLYSPFEGRGFYTVMPDRLEIGRNEEGRPDFLLEYVRGGNPFLPPEPHGILTFRLVAHYPSAAALEHLRGLQRQGALQPARFDAGYLRIQPIEGVLAEGDIPPELLHPEPLLWSSLDARYTLRLSEAGASFVEQALQGEQLLFQAVAVCEAQGIVPRLPLQVRFDPAELLATLLALGDENRLISYPALASFFQRDPGQLPLQLEGFFEPSQQASLFATAMIARIRTRFGEFAPAPLLSTEPHIALPAPDAIGHGTFLWDLAEPLQAPLPWVFTLHPLEAAQAVVRAEGVEALVRQTIVPALATGGFGVTVAANLPAQLQGILSLGVTLQAPPQPPHRMQAIIKTVELPPGQEKAEVYLQFSPVETPLYTYQAFVIASDSGGVARWVGSETSHASSRLLLRPSDFPVGFVPIEASADLLEVAVIHGILRWQQAQAWVETPFTLDTAQPLVTLLLPPGAEGATLQLEAQSRDSGDILALGPFPGEGLRLSLFSFAEYGPHEIEVSCIFDTSTPLFAIDLLPEDQPETAETITVLSLTPAQPKRTWRWFASNPFRAGYRCRPHAGDAALLPWSEVHSPAAPLIIDLRQEGGVEESG